MVRVVSRSVLVREPLAEGGRAANLVEFRDRELEETFQERVAQEAQRELDRRWGEAGPSCSATSRPSSAARPSWPSSKRACRR